jgi:hypothetical protein
LNSPATLDDVPGGVPHVVMISREIDPARATLQADPLKGTVASSGGVHFGNDKPDESKGNTRKGPKTWVCLGLNNIGLFSTETFGPFLETSFRRFAQPMLMGLLAQLINGSRMTNLSFHVISNRCR